MQRFHYDSFQSRTFNPTDQSQVNMKCTLKCGSYLFPFTLALTLQSTRWASQTRLIYFLKKIYARDVVSNREFLQPTIFDVTSSFTKNMYKLAATDNIR